LTFFFVPPRLTFAVADSQYIITFVALFIVGVVISTLVTRARERAEVMRVREVQTASLYYLSRDLAVCRRYRRRHEGRYQECGGGVERPGWAVSARRGAA